MAKGRARRALALVALIGVVGTTAAEASSSASSDRLSAAQATNPFTDPNVFCKQHSAPAGTRNSSAPGVSPTSINITNMSIDTKALRAFGADLQDFDAAFKAFWDEVNRCGGINGRKIVLKNAKYNPLATDIPGHLQALCLKATEDHKAMIVMGVGSPAAQRCVAINHRSVFVNSTNNVPSADYRQAKGRIVGIYPGVDRQALAFINDALAQGVFKGKKVAVVGVANPPTAAQEIQDFYIEPLKAKGVDVVLNETLPCTGTVCTQGLGSAVGRMRSKGVELIVMTHHVSLTTAGPLVRELRAQGNKAPIWGPFYEGNHGDSVLGGIVRSAGSDGSRYLADLGWYAFNITEVYNAWRIGRSKETAFAKMCTATLAKANKERQYLFNEQDISNGRWGGTANICIQVRAFASALWSLGNNVTTDRLVAALREQAAVDRRDTTQSFRDNLWYNDRDQSPSSGVQIKFNFPCPAPRTLPNDACFLPVDRPPRVRKVTL